ncbi:hypothetical protein AAHA92_18036 [Salvia divinorum]|uniref:Uncharacterized protein n=1 Tax=Salvia divinorum TaxID=28513 RepID=A0ABD1H0R8_SALDI
MADAEDIQPLVATMELEWSRLDLLGMMLQELSSRV